MKTFHVSKDTIKGMERKHIGWEKIVVNHISDKELISRIYKDSYKLRTHTYTNNSIKK